MMRSKGEKGQALILTLIFLAVGTLMIVPALNYTVTGLYSVRVYENALTRLYNADRAVEDALWQLLDQLIGNFSPENPEIVYDFQVGATHLPVTIKIPTVPASQNYGTGNVHNLMIEVEPTWVETPPDGGDPILEYIMRIDMQTYNLTSFRYTLPEGLTYVPSSAYYKGPDGNAALAWNAEVNLETHQVQNKSGVWVNMSSLGYTVVYSWPPVPYNSTTSYLYVITEADGRQTLEFRPYFGTLSGRRILIQTVQVSGTPPWGVNFIEPAVFTGGFGTIIAEQTAAVGVAMYTIEIPIGGAIYQVVVGYDYATGGFKIVSYQVIG